MESRKAAFRNPELVEKLSAAVKEFFNLHDPILRVNDSYNINIILNKNGIEIGISETKFDQTMEHNLEQIENLKKTIATQNTEILNLKDEMAKLESGANKNDKQLREKIADLEYKVRTETPSPKVVSSFDDPPGRSGWTVIQCRKTGQLDFITESYLYNIGFGDPSNEYWIGCEKLHKITNSQRHELYIDLEDCTGRQFFARYSNFSIGSLEEKYRLKSLGKYSGNAGDALRDHENQNFEFYNNWKGVYKSFSWWTAQSFKCNLNGNYNITKTNLIPEGFWWGELYSLKYCKMSIRPNME
ncbi:ryncolin-1-like [Drosophila elegans]|uniref:ryncolin-1-like n=1 Tax=Drosophila elegans TaxID=30023 RepID=UPI0007E73252|nr:ryncolin-1-like [Drosophila elegans]